MLSLTITSDFSDLPADAIERVLSRFEEEAGKLIVESVQSVLGTEEIYTLSPAYSAEKIAGKTHPPMRRIPSKAEDQPLILTGSLYEGITCRREGNSLVLGIEDGAGIADNGYDYAEKWEQATQFLEKGLALAEPKLADILTTILIEELMLG